MKPFVGVAGVEDSILGVAGEDNSLVGVIVDSFLGVNGDSVLGCECNSFLGESPVGVFSEKSDTDVVSAFAGDRKGEPNEVSDCVGVRTFGD